MSGTTMDPSAFFSPVYALTVATRMAQRSPEGKALLAEALKGRLAHQLDAALEVAVETGEPMGAVLAERFAQESSDVLAERLARRLSEDPYRHAWPLHELGLQATGRFLEVCRKAWPRPGRRKRAVLAGLSHNHGRRLLLLGRPAEALPYLDDAFDLYDSRDQGAASARIQCLASRSEALTLLSRLPEALSAAEAAAAASREAVAKRNRKDLIPARLSLAGHLINLCGCLADVERHADALAVIEEAVALFEQHRAVAGHAQAYARALLCQGNELHHLGLYQEAAEAMEKAIALARDLETDRATAFEPDLALALADLALLYEQLGRGDDAQAALNEAVERFRRLEDRYPESFRPSLAWSLSLPSPSEALADSESSLSARAEAVERYRRLTAAEPGFYEPELGKSLFLYSEALFAHDSYRAALKPCNQAIARLRRAPFARRDLAWSYVLRSRIRAALGHRRKAIADARAAVELLEQRSAQQASFYRQDLATALTVLGIHLHSVGDFQEAVRVTRWAEAIFRGLADATPQVFTEDLAACLNNLSHHLYEAGEPVESVRMGQVSSELYRTLAEQRPSVVLGLAANLASLAPRLCELGRPEEALQAAVEAVDLHAKVEPRPAEQAAALHGLGVALLELARHEEALPPLQKAVRILRRLAREEPETHDVDLACSLASLGKSWSGQKQYDKALAATRSSVRLLRRVIRRGEEFLRPRLAATLSNQAHQLCKVGKPEAGFKSAEEAVRLLTPYLLEQPDRYIHWATVAVGHYLRAAEQGGVEPDMGLVAEIAVVFARSELPQSDPLC